MGLKQYSGFEILHAVSHSRSYLGYLVGKI